MGRCCQNKEYCHRMHLFQRPWCFQPVPGWENHSEGATPRTALLTGGAAGPFTKPKYQFLTGQSVQAAGFSSQGQGERKECIVLLCSRRACGIHFSSSFAFIWFPNCPSRLLMFPPSTNCLKEKQLSFLEFLRELSVPRA